MGRVAKYKKIKACDPFAKRSTKDRSGLMSSSFLLDPKRKASLKKRARREKRKKGKSNSYDDGFDAPPQEDEQDDFDLSDPSLKVKRKQKRRKLDHGLHQASGLNEGIVSSVIPNKNKESEGLTCHIPQTDKDESKVARILNLKQAKHDKPVDGSNTPAANDDGAQISKKGPATTQGRQEGESLTAFRKRLDKETQDVLIKSKQKSNAVMNPEKAAKKKAYLEKRKQLKKGRRRLKGQQLGDSDDEDNNQGRNRGDDDDDGFITGERALAKVNVGLTEQVERPPIFNVLPRGAKKKEKKNPAGWGAGGMSEEQEARERRAMEMMREKVIASYALMKAKRKNA